MEAELQREQISKVIGGAHGAFNSHLDCHHVNVHGSKDVYWAAGACHICEHSAV